LFSFDPGTDPFIRNRYGDDALQTACLKGAIQVFSHLIENILYTKERIAEAYELLGSTYLDEHFDIGLTMEYWRQALTTREAGEGLRGKRIEKRLPPPNPAYLNAREFTSFAELNAVISDLDAMRMQSLMISERILGAQHKEMIYRLMYRGAAYADGLQYQRCVSLWFSHLLFSILISILISYRSQVDLWKYSFILRIRKDSLLHNEAAFTAHALVSAHLLSHSLHLTYSLNSSYRLNR